MDTVKSDNVILNTGEWQGSENTASLIRKQIVARWGEAEGKNYNPLKNCFTYKTWESKGFHVIKKEKALKSLSVLKIAKLDDRGKPNTDNVVTRRRLVNLFYIKQVEADKN